MPNKVHDFSGVLDTWVAPTGGVTEGTDYTIGDARVLARETADAGDTFSAELLAPHNGKQYEVSKVGGTGLAWTVGQAIYETSSGAYTTTASGNTYVGTAVKVASATATVGWIVFTSSHAR